ncbi:MAG: histidine kinase dimerization/phospho-acceptor domain-containing protein, partial [bacterium]
MKHLLLKFSIIILLIDLSSLIFILPIIQEHINDWQDKKIEQVYRPKVAPLMAELKSSAQPQWAEIANKYQDLWRIPVLITNKQDKLIENWYHEYLGQGKPPQLLIASADRQAIIWLGEDQYIIAGPFVDGLLYSYAHRIFPVIALVIMHLLALYYLIRHEERRNLSILKRLKTLNNEHKTSMPILDRGPDTSGQIAREVNQTMINVEQLQKNHKKSLNAHKDLLHAVAHELRTPLARAQFALNLLTDNKDPDEQQLFLRDIESSMDGLDELVGEVLGYSRLQHAEIPLHIKELDLAPLITTIIDELKSIYPTTLFSPQSKPLTFNADPRLLKRALSNLISNAAAYGRKEVAISWEKKDALILIYVDDDGDGVPPGKRERIFEPFTRLDSSRD